MKNLKKILATCALILAVSAPHYIAQATISSTTTTTLSSAGDGVTTNYTIGFTFRDNDDLLVYLRTTATGADTLLVYGAGAGKYTITGGDPGTTVVMGTAPTSAQQVYIVRSTPITQTVDYVETDAFPATSHEAQMDKIVMVEQELSGAVAAITAGGASVLATSSNTPNAVVKRDSSGNFSAGTITAALTGNATTATTAVNVSGVVAAVNGGTGLSTYAVGDIVYASGTSTLARLAKGSSGSILVISATTALPAWSTISTSFTTPTVQRLTSGSGTYTLPTSPSTPAYIRVTLIGAGGGGGGTGTGGATAGGAGGSTFFGSLALIQGGGGGGADAPGTAAAGGAGGSTLVASPAVTVIAMTGNAGNSAAATGNIANPVGPAGAPSPFGGGGKGAGGVSNGNAAAANSGAGGGGGGIASTTNGSNSGGSGGYVQAIIANPSATYSYSIGAGGSVGSAGTSGATGGLGGSGIVIVEEFYR